MLSAGATHGPLSSGTHSEERKDSLVGVNYDHMVQMNDQGSDHALLLGGEQSGSA